ncbi:Nse4 C-terminal-domain-containing protein [Lentinula boryana]|uniref:Non-structural maintenance of chromosomes element 4 n=1 Tax=Lentinula boryana TaxID=40481 RepID=A0ABQ8QKT6_9AGAR|nr:Nse4 C-terminal-domain-containing protein [Lentinula boryana]
MQTVSRYTVARYNSLPSPGLALIYNPDQNPEDKRELRRKYYALQLQLQAFDQKCKQKQRAHELGDILGAADILSKRVRDTPEALLDADVIVNLSSKSRRLTRELQFGSGMFDFDEYVLNLVTFMGGRKVEPESVEEISNEEDEPQLVKPLQWERIGKLAMRKSKRVTVVGFMLGPFLLQDSRKRKRKQSTRLKINKADERRPQEITEEALQRSTNETMRNVLTIHAILQEVGPANLFQLIINPASFAQSVENLFYLSFLIREGKAGLDLGEDSEPMIYIPDDDPNQPQMQTHQHPESRQTVFELDMATWKRGIEVFKISEPLIPHRDLFQTRIGNK